MLILAGVTIATLTGDNGIIKQTGSAKEKTEIANEKEIIDLATVQAMQKNKYGEIAKENLEDELKGKFNGEDGKVADMEDGTFTVTCPSKRVYEVDENGNVTYLGKESELSEKVEITADKEKDSTPKLVQEVKIKLKTYVPVENENITLAYAWATSKEESPEEDEFTTATLEQKTKATKEATIYSSATTQGDYYLWIKAVINGKETQRVFGEYAIKEHTTLVCCKNEKESTSTFLGMPIQRNLIKSVKIQTELEGHSKDDGTCYDVTANGSGAILAWYTEETINEETYYNVTIAERGGVVANADSGYLFSYIGYGISEEVTITGLENLDTSNVTSMSYMFFQCNKLKNLDVSKFNTSNVTSMYTMFEGCESVVELDVSNFDTSKVTTMYRMFRSCRNLTNLDLSGFDTKNVTSMNGMFNGCNSLRTLNVSGFNTNNVTNMQYMFNGCNSLIRLDLSSFNTSKLNDMFQLFAGCNSLTSLDLSNFDTSNVTSMFQMFLNCKNLTKLDLSNFDTSKVNNMFQLFAGCNSLTSLDVSKFNTSKVENMMCMFSNCNSLKSLDVSKFNTSKVKDMSQMFLGCNSLTSLDVSSFDTGNVTTMVQMFSGCGSLTSLDLSGFDISNVTSIGNLFFNCKKLMNLDISNFKVTEKLTANWATLYGVPSTIKIKTNSSMAEWIKANFTNITDSNIELVSESNEEAV